MLILKQDTQVKIELHILNTVIPFFSPLTEDDDVWLMSYLIYRWQNGESESWVSSNMLTKQQEVTVVET